MVEGAAKLAKPICSCIRRCADSGDRDGGGRRLVVVVIVGASVAAGVVVLGTAVASDSRTGSASDTVCMRKRCNIMKP